MLFVVEEAGPILYRINLHCFPTLLEKFWFKESFEIMIDFILGSPSIHPPPAQAGWKLGKLLGNDLIHLDLIVNSFLLESESLSNIWVWPLPADRWHL